MREAEQTDIQKQVREDTTRYRDGDEQHLDFVLEFKNKQGFNTTEWAKRLEKFQSFFGPGIEARMSPSKRGNYGGMDIALIVDGSGQGRDGGEREGVLPPLLPGLAPRRGDM